MAIACLLLTTLLVLPWLTGCASSRDFRQADGWMTHVISCGGPFLDMGHCLEKAGEVCRGRGYQVLNSAGDSVPDPALAVVPGGGMPNVPLSYSALTRYPKRKLHIKCN